MYINGKTIIKSLLILLLTASVWLMNFFVYADVDVYNGYKPFDLQGYLIEKYLENSDLLSDLPAKAELGNIYDAAYKIAENTETKSTIQSLDYLVTYINKFWNCDLKKSDVYNLFDQTLEARILAQQATKHEVKIIAKEDKFVKSCQKVSKCVNKNGTADADEGVHYNISTYFACTNMVNGLYELAKSNAVTFNELSHMNMGDDMFANGTLEDSSYDLLVDVQEIGKVLFHDNKDASDFKFYEMPTKSAGGGNGGNNAGAQNVGNNRGNNVGNNAGNNGGNNGGNNAGNNVGNNGGNNGGNNAGNNEGGGFEVEPEEDVPLIIDENDDTEYIDIQGADNSLVACNECLSVNEEGNVKPVEEEDEIDVDDEIKNLDEYTENLYAANEELDEAGAMEEALVVGIKENDPEEIKTQMADMRDILLSQGNNAAVDDMDDCVSSCDSGSPIDIMACKMNCMCKASADADSIFTIKFCLVPTKVRNVMDGVSVLSIEEMVEEINNILTDMKETGALIKHKHTDEFWEVSLQDIKLSRILAFDFVLAYKPIFDIPRDEAKEKSKEVEFNKNLEKNILGHYDSMSLAVERDKFMVLGEPEVDLARKKVSPTLEQYQFNVVNQALQESAKKVDTSNVEENIQKELNMSILYTYGEFLDNNEEFWMAVDMTLHGVLKTAGALKEKIKQGK